MASSAATHTPMEKQQQHEVAVVGAGIAGLATAVALRRVGLPSLVLEKSPELRAAGAALTLFPNAWRALEALGVAHKLIPLYHAIERYASSSSSSPFFSSLLLFVIMPSSCMTIIVASSRSRVTDLSSRSAIRGLAVFPEGHELINAEALQYLGDGKRAGLVSLNSKELYFFITHTSTAAGKPLSPPSSFTVIYEELDSLT
ncbi:hypothetical protein BHM03_00038153 [Ensete ventricosum]|nr:hypothetical protein BHM03_00038153 [Ensete ventricosum]